MCYLLHLIVQRYKLYFERARAYPKKIKNLAKIGVFLRNLGILFYFLAILLLKSESAATNLRR